MAIPTVYAPAFFTGNNSDSTAYVTAWKALEITNVRAVVTDENGLEGSVLSHGSGITVTLVGNTVEFTTDTAVPVTSSVACFLSSDFLQSKDLQNSGNNDVNVRERMFDKLTLAVQVAFAGISETAGLPITFPQSEEAPNQTIPTAPNRLNSFLYFDSNGDLTVYAYATLLLNLKEFLTTGDAGDALENQIVSLSTDKTLAATDMFRLWQVDATTGDKTITCPADADATVAIGSKVDFSLVSSANNVLFVAGSGATLNSSSGSTPQVETQWGGVTLVKTAANTWQLFGRISAV